MEALNKYKVTWVELVPKSGIVPLADQKVFNVIFPSKGAKSIKVHFGSKDSAKAFVASLKDKRLTKSYKALYSTDMQFGMAKDKKIPYTQKQLAEAELI